MPQRAAFNLKLDQFLGKGHLQTCPLFRNSRNSVFTGVDRPQAAIHFQNVLLLPYGER